MMENGQSNKKIKKSEKNAQKFNKKELEYWKILNNAIKNLKKKVTS